MKVENAALKVAEANDASTAPQDVTVDLNADKAENADSKAIEIENNVPKAQANRFLDSANLHGKVKVHPNEHSNRVPDQKDHQQRAKHAHSPQNPQDRNRQATGNNNSHQNLDLRDHQETTNNANSRQDHNAKDLQETANANSGETDVGLRVKPHPVFKAIYNVTLEEGSKRLGTKNLTPGKNVYGERLVKFKGVEYRVWDAFRSKLAGAIIKGLQTVPIETGSKVLYLGAASGTTPSHVSDIVGESGYVYCVEFAQRSLRDLVNNVAVFRPNISPMLEDARMPERYAMFISGKVDVIYCDVAQPEQAKLLADNADYFLKPQGWVMLACKSQSIDVTMAPTAVYEQEARILRKRGYDVKEIVELDPYDKAHAMIVAQKI